MTKFFKAVIVFEAKDENDICDIVNVAEKSFDATYFWLTDKIKEMGKTEIMQFFGYDEETYQEMVASY
jgi:hypothetical protein